MDLNFDAERELLVAKRTELLTGVAVIDEALAALTRGSKNGKLPYKAQAAVEGAGIQRKRAPMSPAAREAARKRMKAYWRERRKAARK
jgi:hypothetical protein